MADDGFGREGPAPQSWDRWYRPRAPEWLDDPAASDARKAAVMRGLDRFNRRVFAYRRFASWVLDALPASGPARVLELGAGHGSLSRQVARVLDDGGRARTVVASDVDPTLVASMQADRALRSERIEVRCLDATRLDLNDGAVDVAVFVQALHHLEPAQVAALMSEGTRVARTLILVDGWRHPAMMVVTPAFLALGNYPAFHDGVISLARMYSIGALAQLAARAPVPLCVDARFAFPGYMVCRVQRRVA